VRAPRASLAPSRAPRASLASLVLVAAVAAATSACSSQPTADRPPSPSRPEVQRPDGVEPDGLAEVRDALSAQRAEARELDNTLHLEPNTVSMDPSPGWVETVLTEPLRWLGLW
jgi:hypothetical protein